MSKREPSIIFISKKSSILINARIDTSLYKLTKQPVSQAEEMLIQFSIAKLNSCLQSTQMLSQVPEHWNILREAIMFKHALSVFPSKKGCLQQLSQKRCSSEYWIDL